MKKIIAILLSALLLCGTAALAEDVTGAWYLSQFVMEDVAINPADMGMEMTLELNGDGTMIMSAPSDEGEEKQEGTWTQADNVLTVVIDDTPQEFTVEEDDLRATMDETSYMLFTREAPVGYVAPAKVAAADIADFEGIYTCTDVVMEGMHLDGSLIADELGALGATGTDVTIENGYLTLCGMALGNLNFEDGALYLMINEELNVDVSVALTEEGIVATMSGIDFYCAK